MSLMTLSEKSQTRSYGLLSSRISEAISHLEQDSRLPDPGEREVLSRGLELVDKFILGSRLVEGDDFTDGLLPTTDTLKAYRYAKSTLAVLETLRKDEQISQALKSIREKLEKIIAATNGHDLDVESLSRLRQFFTTLSTLLCQDVIRQRFEGEPTKTTHIPANSLDGLESGCNKPAPIWSNTA